jgi:hypothetical protein
MGKYNNDFKKKLVSKLEDFKDKDDYVNIFNIISSDDYSSNSNGIFYNLNDFSDEVIEKLVDYLNENKVEKEKEKEQVVYTTYCNENGIFKVSNQDKQIMNNMKNKEITI